jgi:hypothetical protein
MANIPVPSIDGASNGADTFTGSAAGQDGLYGVYWQGGNGNIYVQGNNGQIVNAGNSLGASSSLYRQVADPNAPVASTGNGSGTTTASTSGSGTPDYGALENAYNAQFDNAMNGLNQQKDLAGQISQAGQNQVNQSYGIQSGGLDQQLAQGNANLDLAQNKLDTYKSNGIRDLGSEMRQAVQSYGNQLGVAGAGDSSAVALANYGLSKQGNRAMGDLNTSADQQQTGLNLQRTTITQSFDQNKKLLDDWKSQQIQNIVNNYASQLQQIQSQVGSAQSQRAIDLAYIGKGQAANQALSQLSTLQQSYGSNLSQLQNAYGQLQAPSTTVAGYNDQFTVNPLTSDQVSANSLANNTASTTFTPTAIKLKSDDTST